jgi:hypothetical protein
MAMVTASVVMAPAMMPVPVVVMMAATAAMLFDGLAGWRVGVGSLLFRANRAGRIAHTRDKSGDKQEDDEYPYLTAHIFGPARLEGSHQKHCNGQVVELFRGRHAQIGQRLP